MKNNAVSVKTSKATKVRSLSTVNQMVRAKQSADLMRFRTCCCDPRASKWVPLLIHIFISTCKTNPSGERAQRFLSVLSPNL